MRNMLKKCLCVLFVLILLTAFEVLASAETATVSVSGRFLQTDCRAMLDLVNQYRTSDTWYWNSDDTTKTTVTGREPLQWSYELEKVAMQRAMECAVSYSHTRPDGTRCFSAFYEQGIGYSSAGENIAAGYSSAESVFYGWWEENCSYSGQGHRRNLLNASYNAIGIAGVYANGTYYWAQSLARTNSIGTACPANDAVTVMSVNVDTGSVTWIGLESQPESVTLIAGESTALPDQKVQFQMENTWTWGDKVTANDSPTYTVSGDGLSVKDGKLYAAAAGTGTLTGHFLGQTFEIPVNVLSSDTKKLSFDANGGSGAPETVTGLQYSQITLPADTPVHNEKIFVGWAESPTAEEASYAPGDTFTLRSSMTLYAVWRDIDDLRLSMPSSVEVADITVGGQTACWIVRPPVTGTYEFCSVGCYDTFGMLYDSSGSCIASNDDGGDNHNFRISVTLNAGERYKLSVRFYSSGTTGQFLVSTDRPFDDSTAVRLPAGTVSVKASAFSGAGMKAVICPDGMTTIESKAFSGCKNLSEIRIPASVTSIAADAFADCGAFWIYTASGSPAEEAAQTNGWNVMTE